MRLWARVSVQQTRGPDIVRNHVGSLDRLTWSFVDMGLLPLR
jgi:hypothetical protein